LKEHYTIFPLGDSAATIELGKQMSEELNQKVLAMEQWFHQNTFTGYKDIIVAYSSLTLIYDPYIIRKTYPFEGTIYDWIQNKIINAYQKSSIQDSGGNGINRIPVCYDEDFGFDLQSVRLSTNLSLEQIIELHVSKVYRVYMLGFLPGFAYLGEIEPRLIMPRKEIPVKVTEGSVGIVSNQTGIYPLNSPGGWHIIGRTHIKLFDMKDEIPVKLKAGDKVQFYQIARLEFDDWKSGTAHNSNL